MRPSSAVHLLAEDMHRAAFADKRGSPHPGAVEPSPSHLLKNTNLSHPLPRLWRHGLYYLQVSLVAVFGDSVRTATARNFTAAKRKRSVTAFVFNKINVWEKARLAGWAFLSGGVELVVTVELSSDRMWLTGRAVADAKFTALPVEIPASTLHGFQYPR